MKEVSVRVRLAFKLYSIILMAITICVFMVGAFTYYRNKQALEEDLGIGLKNIAATAALNIDGDKHDRIEATSDKAYVEIKEYLEKVAKANNLESPIYTLKPEGKDLVFVVTTERGGIMGGKYRVNPYIKKALRIGESTFSPIYSDKNGIWISAYAPIRNAEGKIRAVLELDYQIDYYIRKLHYGLTAIVLVCFVAFFVATFLAIPFIRPIITSIKSLDTAAKKLEEEDYDYPIRVKSNDEIGHLASTFEEMRRSIKDYITQLRNAWFKEKKAHLDSIKALSKAIAIREPYAKGHIERVSLYAEIIARELGMSEEDIEKMKYGCILHDVGKIGVDIEIIKKSTSLTPEEQKKIQQHPEMGLEIIKDVEFLERTKDVILYHQEHYDGKGYPKGLKGEDIPLSARIVALADAYDAMSSDRPYRKSIGKEKILDRIKKESGKQFDPKVVEAFFKVKDKIDAVE